MSNALGLFETKFDVAVPSSWFGAEAWLGSGTPAIAQNVGKISEAEMMPV